MLIRSAFVRAFSESATKGAEAAVPARAPRKAAEGDLFSLQALARLRRGSETNYYMEEMRSNTAIVDELARRADNARFYLHERMAEREKSAAAGQGAAGEKSDAADSKSGGTVAYIKRTRHIFPGDTVTPHPADSKVVALLSMAALPADPAQGWTEARARKLRMIAGPRYNGKFDEVRISGESAATAAENREWCELALARLVSTAKSAIRVDGSGAPKPPTAEEVEKAAAAAEKESASQAAAAAAASEAMQTGAAAKPVKRRTPRAKKTQQE